MATGHYGKGLGLLVVTDRRLLFFIDGVMNKQTEDFAYTNINSIAWQSGMTQGTVVVSSGGTRAEIKNVNKQDGKLLVDQARDVLTWTQQQRQAPAPIAQPVAAPSAVTDHTAQLVQAAELHRSGVLSDAAFAALKAKILAS